MSSVIGSSYVIEPDGGRPVACRPPSRLRAMVVEDENALAGLVGAHLERDGLEVTIAGDARAAVELARDVAPDVIVLGLGLPGLDGVEVCRQVRTRSDAYVVLLTARTEEVDTLIGLSVGADDYVTKPFSPRELTDRFQAMMRRARSGPDAAVTTATVAEMPVRTFGAIAIDSDAREVTVGGGPVSLTRAELDILGALARGPGVVFARSRLIAVVREPRWVGDDHLVDVHIGHSRSKLGDDVSRGSDVRTVRGVGYRMGSG